MLFPRGRGRASWTTTDSSRPFEDPLKPLQHGNLPNVALAPDRSTAHENVYPADEVGGNSRFLFYTAGDIDVESSREITFAYSVYFAEGFDWTKGGKLPGIYGGTSLEVAKSCSGGSKRTDCFSARLMWRKEGKGELYNYFYGAPKNAYCDLPNSTCNTKTGESVGTGKFMFKTGQWNTVAQRLKLNDPGQTNGEQELFFNGESVISLTNVAISDTPNTKVFGIMAETFFGGTKENGFAPTSAQTAWFKDWSLSIT